jgi:LacI family transcriptional regulator
MAARMLDVEHAPSAAPLVIVNGMSADGLPNILPDERRAGEEVARHVLQRGHERIAIIGELPDIAEDLRRSATLGERFAGITSVLTQAGVTPVRVTVPSWGPEIGYDYTHQVLEDHPDVTAIIAGNDNVAFGIYQAAASLGLRVGEDLSVISFDDEELTAYHRPGLTTAHLPYEEMARYGVEMLIGDREPGHMLVPMPLIVRQSVRVLPRRP